MDALLVENPKIVLLKSDSARFAYVVLLGRAKFQKPEGTFASRAHLNSVLGRYSRYVTELINAGLLDASDGRLTVHDWPIWQTDSSTARVAAWRRGRLSVVKPG